MKTFSLQPPPEKKTAKHKKAIGKKKSMVLNTKFNKYDIKTLLTPTKNVPVESV